MYKRTAFSHACLHGHLEVVKCIIKMIIQKHGKDKMELVLNKADLDGETSLFGAASKGHLQVVQYLVNVKETDVTMAHSK